jgi:hypothetical protein
MSKRQAIAHSNPQRGNAGVPHALCKQCSCLSKATKPSAGSGLATDHAPRPLGGRGVPRAPIEIPKNENASVSHRCARPRPRPALGWERLVHIVRQRRCLPMSIWRRNRVGPLVSGLSPSPFRNSGYNNDQSVVATSSQRRRKLGYQRFSKRA